MLKPIRQEFLKHRPELIGRAPWGSPVISNLSLLTMDEHRRDALILHSSRRTGPEPAVGQERGIIHAEIE